MKAAYFHRRLLVVILCLQTKCLRASKQFSTILCQIGEKRSHIANC